MKNLRIFTLSLLVIPAITFAQWEKGTAPTTPPNSNIIIGTQRPAPVAPPTSAPNTTNTYGSLPQRANNYDKPNTPISSNQTSAPQSSVPPRTESTYGRVNMNNNQSSVPQSSVPPQATSTYDKPNTPISSNQTSAPQSSVPPRATSTYDRVNMSPNQNTAPQSSVPQNQINTPQSSTGQYSSLPLSPRYQATSDIVKSAAQPQSSSTSTTQSSSTNTTQPNRANTIQSSSTSTTQPNPSNRPNGSRPLPPTPQKPKH